MQMIVVVIGCGEARTDAVDNLEIQPGLPRVEPLVVLRESDLLDGNGTKRCEEPPASWRLRLTRHSCI